MSTSGSSAKNSHLTQGGRTTMMPIPVSRITSKCKKKYRKNTCPWVNLLWDFCHSFVQWMGSFFLIVMFCSAIHVYTDRFADMGIIVIRPPGWGTNSSQSYRSYLFSGHKQRRWTVLSELRYKVALTIPIPFSWIGSNVQQEKPLRMHYNTSNCM